MQNRNAATPDASVESMIGRRAAPRILLRVPAMFVVADNIVPVVVLDISPTGARLQVSAPPPKGLFGHLNWLDIEQRCLVMWSDQQTFGVRFTEPLSAHLTAQPAAPSHLARAHTAKLPTPERAAPVERREATRSRTNYPCEVRQGDRWIKTYLKNISRDGFEIIWFPGCRDAHSLYVRGERLPKLKGQVIWINNLAIGCKLEAPLHEAVLADVIARLWGR